MAFRRIGVQCCIVQVSTGATFDTQVASAQWAASGWLYAGTYDIYAVLRSEVVMGVVQSASANSGFNFRLILSP
jgi:hypothetical protein